MQNETQLNKWVNELSLTRCNPDVTVDAKLQWSRKPINTFAIVKSDSLRAVKAPFALKMSEKLAPAFAWTENI